MNLSSNNQGDKKYKKILEQAAEAWVRVCLYNIGRRNLAVAQRSNKKSYEYKTS